MTTAISDVGRSARRRITRRLLPLIFVLYFVAILDRFNLAYAALEMISDLHFSDRVFGFGAGVLFFGYILLEIPGALIAERWSARRWIARIMVTWGLITALTAFIHTPGQFYWARFLLGIAEAGFTPCVLVYLTHWFRAEDRARAIAVYFMASTVAFILGAPLAGWLMGVHWLGLNGWRWLFIAEGIPAVALGIFTLFWLTDWPREARWLPAEERDWLMQELEAEKRAKDAQHAYTIGEALRDRNVTLLWLGYFFVLAGATGFVFWMPTILKRLSGLSTMKVTLLAMIPWVAAFFSKIINGWHSDRTGERRWHAALPLFLGAPAFLAAGLSSRTWLIVALLTWTCGWVEANYPVFWAMPSELLSGSAAAVAFGLINSIGSLGSFVGPYAIGYLSTRTHSFTAGLACMVVSLYIGGILWLCVQPRGRLSNSSAPAAGEELPRRAGFPG
jgi:ACS family tartrate transporter-like MFS transporter